MQKGESLPCTRGCAVVIVMKASDPVDASKSDLPQENCNIDHELGWEERG